MIMTYYALGDSAMIVAYADTVQPYMLEELDQNPNNPQRSSYGGLMLSHLGDCEQAIELGLRGKELMSIDECHY